MTEGSIRRALVVCKRSAYDRYVRQHGMPRVIELLARDDVTVSRLRRADAHHQATINETRDALEALGVKVSLRYRDTLEVPPDVDLVVTVGGDGTLLAVSHNVRDTPLVGVNSAPEDSVGFLCGTQMGHVKAHLQRILEGEAPRVKLARMAIFIDGQRVHGRVLNDALFTHPRPAYTSRYLVEHPSLEGSLQEQKSSGIWVSTAAGSTAAIRSAGGQPMALKSRQLQFVVREPYTLPEGPTMLTRGFVRPGERFGVLNKMREARIFVDGPRISFPVEMGQRVEFALSDEPLVLYGISQRATDARR